MRWQHSGDGDFLPGDTMTTDKRFILTGAFGSGKSTLLHQLRALGYPVVEEAARQILAEQRSIEGNGLPQHDARLFIELMLSRAIYEFRRLNTPTTPVFFDRGIPDMIAYASLFDFDYPPAQNAARQYRYERRVFFLPAWEQIYTPDEERTASFEVASRFGDLLRTIYEQQGYTLIEMPCVPVAERADFLLKFL